MVAATRAEGRGLSGDEVEAIRAGLAAGRKPRVVFTAAAGQIAGQVGQVVRLADPGESDEWVVVRFGRDELPFSPADVAVAPRGTTSGRSGSAGRRASAERRPAAQVPPEPEFVIDKPVVPAPREQPSPPPAVPAAAVPAAAVPAAAPRRARPRPVKGTAGLTVTVAYADGEWTVSAVQGARSLAKPYVIKPAEALKMIGLIDVPGVREAVEEIVAAERARAQEQAQRLRAELAEIEARLAELREAG